MLKQSSDVADAAAKVLGQATTQAKKVETAASQAAAAAAKAVAAAAKAVASSESKKNDAVAAGVPLQVPQIRIAIHQLMQVCVCTADVASNKPTQVAVEGDRVTNQANGLQVCVNL